MRQGVSLPLAKRLPEEGGFLPISEWPHGGAHGCVQNSPIERFKPSALGPEPMQLEISLFVHPHDKQTAVGKNLWPHRVFQNQALLSSEPRNGVDAVWS